MLSLNRYLVRIINRIIEQGGLMARRTKEELLLHEVVEALHGIQHAITHGFQMLYNALTRPVTINFTFTDPSTGEEMADVVLTIGQSVVAGNVVEKDANGNPVTVVNSNLEWDTSDSGVTVVNNGDGTATYTAVALTQSGSDAVATLKDTAFPPLQQTHTIQVQSVQQNPPTSIDFSFGVPFPAVKP